MRFCEFRSVEVVVVRVSIVLVGLVEERLGKREKTGMGRLSV